MHLTDAVQGVGWSSTGLSQSSSIKWYHLKCWTTYFILYSVWMVPYVVNEFIAMYFGLLFLETQVLDMQSEWLTLKTKRGIFYSLLDFEILAWQRLVQVNNEFDVSNVQMNNELNVFWNTECYYFYLFDCVSTIQIQTIKYVHFVCCFHPMLLYLIISTILI